MNNKNIEVPETEIKRIAYDALLYVKEYCDFNNLSYFLAFGTLIGAARHGGFIPWDDDIDILMPREDYEKIISDSCFGEGKWEVLSYKNNNRYLFPWAKVCDLKTQILPSRFNTGLIYGASIDIFPLDALPGDSYKEAKAVQDRIICKYKQIQGRTLMYGTVKGGITNKIKRSLKNVYYRFVGKHLYDIYSEYNQFEKMTSTSKETDYIGYITDAYGSIWKRNDFYNVNGEMMTLNFEGIDFRVPYNYDQVLKDTYGEWRVLPPIEKRVKNHWYHAYYK